MKTLVIYFSLTGNTEALARMIAERLGADLEALRETRPPRGPLGHARRFWAALWGRGVEIAPPKSDPSAYDLVALGAPVWGASAPPVINAYLALAAPRLPALAAFCTEGGSGHARLFRQIAARAGRSLVGTLAVTEKELAGEAARRKVEAFAGQLARVQPAPPRENGLRFD